MFAPYVKNLQIRNCSFDFYYGTEQAREWYDPLKPYALLEYEWVVENINLKNQKIVDGGAHHGQYTVLFAVAAGGTSDIVAVDPVCENHEIIKENLGLNNVEADIKEGVIGPIDGYAQFMMQSNGMIVSEGGSRVLSYRLSSIMSDATIVKLDIEGAEFSILPEQIDAMSVTHTWIVEIHPSAQKDPHQLIEEFTKRGFTALWVNRDQNCVEPYPVSRPSWKSHTTVFFKRGEKK